MWFYSKLLSITIMEIKVGVKTISMTSEELATIRESEALSAAAVIGVNKCNLSSTRRW